VKLVWQGIKDNTLKDKEGKNVNCVDESQSVFINIVQVAIAQI